MTSTRPPTPSGKFDQESGGLPNPRLVFRAAFAGAQKLPDDTAAIETTLAAIFETIAQRLAEIVPDRLARTSPVGHVAAFYSKEKPLFRLVTGLCQGGDALAADTLEGLSKHTGLAPHVEAELAAILPFDLPIYRGSRPDSFRATFDEQARRCAYIVTLDGKYDKPEPDTPLAKTRRGRAYRAQSAFLLRHADLLIAVADPDAEGRAGGALETVRAALEFALPVVFLHTSKCKVSIIEPGDDPATAFAELAAGDEDWPETLCRWVTQTTADPDTGVADPSVDHDYGVNILKEYFKNPEKGRKRKMSVGESLWTWLTARCQPRGARPKSDTALAPYAVWRSRSTSLNYQYSGSYRGAFLLNYLLAACAVAFAALSLVLIGKERHAEPLDQVDKSSHEEPKQGEQPGTEPEAVAATKTDETPESRGPAAVLPATPAAASASSPMASNAIEEFIPWALLFLGAVKFSIVVWIFRNTHRANHGNWNDKAVDYRYLAERLRAMFYLPLIGSFQPPAAAPPQHATRAVRQSAVDWLLDAIVRSVSPAVLDAANAESFCFGETSYAVKVLRLEPVTLLGSVRDLWVWEQSVYHDRTARTMERVYIFAESWGKVCNIAVIGFVAVDVVLVLIMLSPLAPQHWKERLHAATPWLVFFAALLPAVVASVNGVRFQSECRRLAERSAVMRAILRGRDLVSTPPRASRWRDSMLFVRGIFLSWPSETPRIPAESDRGGRWAAADRLVKRINSATADSATDPGSWTPEALRLTESVAKAFVEEVAEWSVLYAKELPEP